MIKELILLACGAGLTFAGAQYNERKKRKDSQLALLRNAYAKWFTAETMFFRRINSLLKQLKDEDTKNEHQQIFFSEINHIEGEIIALITTLNEILLLEEIDIYKDSINNAVKLIEHMFELVSTYNAHTRMHLKLLNTRDEFYEQLKKEIPEDLKAKVQERILEITQLDENCKYLTPASIDIFKTHSEDLHDMNIKFKNIVGKRKLF